MGIKSGAILLTGVTYSFAGEKIAVGKDAAKKAVCDDPYLQAKIIESICKILYEIK